MFTVFDIILLAIIIVSSFFGLYRGALIIIVNFIGFIASIVAAVFLYGYVTQFVGSYIENDLANSIVSGVGSYIISLMVFTFISAKIILLISMFTGGALDRIIGLVLGFVRGMLISLLIFSVTAIFYAKTFYNASMAKDLVLNLSDEKYPTWLQESKTSEFFEEMIKKSINYLPESILDYQIKGDSSEKIDDINDQT